ncbi:MAG: hypothetical protein CFH01_00756 [Alphaproteobacteria bacterium MarineAlpha2_Bin1]|nr:MAG: hypothetical protein CFH01_00756 [Alphaproteobacteria bacterium MarineAlpha2_Bin1]
MSFIRVFLILSIFFLVTLVLIIFQFVAVALNLKPAFIPHHYHKFVIRLISLRVIKYGKCTSRKPLLIVSNHISWLDILVISSSLKVSFVAKKEVKDWPFFGILAQLQRTVFIERSMKDLIAQKKTMAKRLLVGDNLLLFPEGTSSDGKKVLPFKSSLFSLAELNQKEYKITIQPITIAYTGINGLPAGLNERPLFAWFGEMSLISHILTLLLAGPAESVIIFHDPQTIGDFNSRKDLSEHCEELISNGLSRAISGRL